MQVFVKASPGFIKHVQFDVDLAELEARIGGDLSRIAVVIDHPLVG